ncbi:MAG: exosome complex RNA-binding protein Rrp4 [Sulfolobales archaeon]
MEASIRVQNRELVTPGQLLGVGKLTISTPTTVYSVDGRYYSAVVGLVDVEGDKIGVIPLEGFYYPKVGDIVIGIVTSVGVNSWEVDIRAPHPAVLYASDFLSRPLNPSRESLSDYLDTGDVVLAKIENVGRGRVTTLTVKGKGFGKISKGSLIEISSAKIPRVIGKKGSMLQLLVNESKCEIIVAQNGRILVNNCPNKDSEEVVIMAIKKIEKEAHIPGLTDRIKDFIIKEKVRRGMFSG